MPAPESCCATRTRCSAAAWSALARRSMVSTAASWLGGIAGELAAFPEVTLLSRTTAFGYYDGNLVGLLERIADHLAAPPEWTPRQRLWKVRAKSVVLATGAHERGIAYANNDLPGTLLAGAARTYVERYAVRPGSRAVVFTNNDSAYATALALQGAGVDVAAIVDPRSGAALEGALPLAARDAGLPIVAKSVVVGAHGGLRVDAVDVVPQAGGSAAAYRLRSRRPLRRLEPGGPSPLAGARQASLRRRARDVRSRRLAGADHTGGRGQRTLRPCRGAGGRACRRDSLPRCRRAFAPVRRSRRRRPRRSRAEHCSRCGASRRAIKGAKRFVDWQNDVTVDDIALAAREGYRSVEHLKRYTTLGMGTDQGKLSNIVGLALLAEAARIADRGASGRRRSGRRTRRSRWVRSRASTQERISSRRATRPCTTGISRTARGSSTPDSGSVRIRIRAPANRRTMRRFARRAMSAPTSGSSTCRPWARSNCKGRTSRNS